MPDQTNGLLKSFLAAMVSGDAPALAELLSENAVWHTPPSTMEGFRGPHIGRDAVVALLVNVATKVYEPGSTSADIHHLIVDGDVAAAHFRVTGRLLGGAAYDNAYAYIFRLSDGAIDEVWEHVDTAQFYNLLSPNAA